MVMNTTKAHSVTGVILAGGQGQRMGGLDKGLLMYQQQPLIQHIINTLSTQVDSLVINANRNVERYQQFGYPVILDSLSGFCGPLAGMYSVMKATKSDYILTAPCDSPTISTELRQRMMEVLLINQADIAVAHDGNRTQPVFCLINCNLRDDLERFLKQGDRKIDLWFEQHKLAEVDFSDQPDSFINFNHPEDISEHLKPIVSPLPIIGFSAFSGTGKTTLLTQLIPLLKAKGIEVAVIKHAHHKFEVDVPGKDSYQIRKAGAQQTLITSSCLMALMQTNSTDLRLADVLPRLDTTTINVILVEGFKDEQFSKIELHRPSLGKPLLYPEDDSIIAIASDQKSQTEHTIDHLDLNDIDAIAKYIEHFIAHWTS